MIEVKIKLKKPTHKLFKEEKNGNKLINMLLEEWYKNPEVADLAPGVLDNLDFEDTTEIVTPTPTLQPGQFIPKVDGKTSEAPRPTIDGKIDDIYN